MQGNTVKKNIFICVIEKDKFKITITQNLILNLPFAITQINLQIIMKMKKFIKKNCPPIQHDGDFFILIIF